MIFWLVVPLWYTGAQGSFLNMEVACFSETLVLSQKNTECNSQMDH
jgi:uncharacterized membrane protein